MSFQVSKYFTEIFKKLVPNGHAVLIMKKGEADQDVSKLYNVVFDTRTRKE